MSTMTLKQVRDALRNPRGLDASGFDADDMADAIDAHVAQPAQAVGVDSLMSQAQVFASAWSLVGGKFDSGDALENAEEAKAELRTMITRALSGEKAGRVADDRAKLLEIMEGFDTQTNVCPKCWEETDIRDFDMANDLRAYLSASPTPDKEGKA